MAAVAANVGDQRVVQQAEPVAQPRPQVDIVQSNQDIVQ
jgi:hypothetical protein